ncbi:MAG: phosphoenolpyruvate synthase [Bacteroidia bacterium]|nr:phosphoenolpyruvate synthase [Bacteroidia bacterium]
METFYTPIDISALLYKKGNLKTTPLGQKIESFIARNAAVKDAEKLIPETAQLLYDIRKELLSDKRATVRLDLLDISVKLEEIIFKQAPQWNPKNLKELIDKIYYLGLGTTGAGYIELWEWDQIKEVLRPPSQSTLSLGMLTRRLEGSRSLVEWSASMVRANYEEVVQEYTAFEPKAYGFIDDRIRGSIALHLGKSVGELGDFIATESSITNKVMQISNQSSIRGLNPGYAYGELVVVDGSPESIEVSSEKIYVFQRPPGDLKPIAGIATVAEGNIVSHVQLLARNLGIPNAALSDENLKALKKFSDQKVFYAVSNKGNVILKSESDMTSEEKNLFTKKVRKEEKIEVPIEKIRLDRTKVLNLRDVDANDSGNLCGPKAANLGQLKKMFPENVVEGLVIPFGIFREHMDQTMPGQNKSYWQFLNDMFAEADRRREQNVSENEVENYQLRELETLRTAIKSMSLKPSFLSEIEVQFKSILGKPMGEIPVFLRSDTNMEDLKDFTGAGLNLTLFNVVERAKILQGIKDVWASPYTERSFKWRQKYLSNPENVFPSILVIPSVDVDYSGVLITKGISSGVSNDLTVAISRGAGGAVDGQSAESYLIRMDESYELLAPAREPYYNSLPVSGGTLRKGATFEKRILTKENITAICKLAEQIRETLPKATNSDYDGAYDVELGFKDNKLWLFQVRPFVENKIALSSNYLESITPRVNTKKEIALSTTL